MQKNLWDQYFVKMRILVYLQLGLIIYSGFAAFSVWRNNLELGLLMSVSIVVAFLSIYIIIKSASDSWQLEQAMKKITSQDAE